MQQPSILRLSPEASSFSAVLEISASDAFGGSGGTSSASASGLGADVLLSIFSSPSVCSAASLTSLELSTASGVSYKITAVSYFSSRKNAMHMVIFDG